MLPRKYYFFTFSFIAFTLYVYVYLAERLSSSLLPVKTRTNASFKNIKNTNLQAVDTSQILNSTKTVITMELQNYNFRYSGVYRMEDLVLESGGQPLRSLIISTWGSGSTFLGEILNAMPGNFFHYEPLLNYSIIQIRGSPHGDKALRTIKNMLKCNFDSMEEYFAFGKTHLHQFSHNTRLWDQCKYIKDLCFDASFTTSFCRLFPFQTMKVVQIRLRFLEYIFRDEGLNVKAVFLVRDPRGVMQSRIHNLQPPKYRDYWEPDLVCGDMVSDYIAAVQLLKRYPDRLTVLRFEDFVRNPLKTAHGLFDFLDLNRMPEVEIYLATHFNKQKYGETVASRAALDLPFKWKNELSYNYVHEVQLACKDAMYLWGYRMTYNASHMTSQNFNPVKKYSIWRRSFTFKV